MIIRDEKPESGFFLDAYNKYKYTKDFYNSFDYKGTFYQKYKRDTIHRLRIENSLDISNQDQMIREYNEQRLIDLELCFGHESKGDSGEFMYGFTPEFNINLDTNVNFCIVTKKFKQEAIDFTETVLQKDLNLFKIFDKNDSILISSRIEGGHTMYVQTFDDEKIHVHFFSNTQYYFTTELSFNGGFYNEKFDLNYDLDIYDTYDRDKKSLQNNYYYNSMDRRINVCLSILLFTKYGNVKEVQLKANSKPVKVNGEKIRNDSNQDVTVLDATWYTTYKRDTPFGVRGHWRQQACGVGRKDRKLVYINDFVKKGYTRTAKKLK